MIRLLLFIFLMYSPIFAYFTNNPYTEPGYCPDTEVQGSNFRSNKTFVSSNTDDFYGDKPQIGYHYWKTNNHPSTCSEIVAQYTDTGSTTMFTYYNYSYDVSPYVPCQPLSDVTVSLSQSQCTGSTTVYSNNMATQGTLQYQECDNSCYVLEPQNIPCSTVVPYLKSQCDTDVNQLNLTCDDSNSSFTSYDYQCTSDNNNTNPCQDAYNQLSSTCSNGTIQGSCQDNGMIITSNSLECVPPSPDISNPCDDVYQSMLTQCNVNNQTLIGNCTSKDGNITSNTFQCVSKFIDNNNSNSSVSLTDTNNLLSGLQSDITVVNNNLNSLSNSAENINNKISNTNNKLSKVNNNLDLINNKLTTTNNNLNDIKNINKSSRDTLKDIKTGVDGLGDKLDDINNKLPGL